jgi:hypothetical protein
MIIDNHLMTSASCTISEALARLENMGKATSGHIKLKSLSIQGDCGLDANIVSLLFTSHEGDNIVIGLPTAVYFDGFNFDTRKVERRDALELEGAIVDRNGNVALTTGGIFRSIEIHRSTALKNPSTLEQAFVLFALSMVSDIDKYYVSPFSNLPDVITDAMPNQLRLDWFQLVGAAHNRMLKIPPIKKLCHEFTQSTGFLISIETARTALVKSGLYRSKRRPTAQN